MLWLGVDMGGTATRWGVRDAGGALVARGAVAGATALPDPVVRRAFVRALSAVADAAPGPIKGAVVGLTGSGLHADAELTAATAQALGLASAQVTIFNDMVLAWHTAYPQGGGHLIAAGTGSVGLSIDGGGAVTLVGGRGSLIDDAGSGAWIALRALDALWRVIDQHGAPKGAEILAEHLFGALGGSDWDTTRRAVYAGDRGRIAALAPAVAAAATAGDAIALSLMTRAGQELARLASALIARCGPAPIGVTGGVLALHPTILAAMQAAVPDAALRLLTLDAAAHAATMARHLHASDTP